MQAGSDQELVGDTTQTGVASPADEAHDQPAVTDQTGITSWRWWPVVWITAVGIILAAFCLYSRPPYVAPIPHFPRLPLYGNYLPTFSRLGWWLIPAGLLLAAIAWAAISTRVRTWVALTLIVLGGWVASIAVNLLRGHPSALIHGVSTKRIGVGPGLKTGASYTTDLHFVDDLGVRGFVQHFSSMQTQFNSWNIRTHPPGTEVMLWVFYKLAGPGHPFRFATVLAVVSLLAAVGAYALGRAYGGERAGRIAAVLTVATPSLLMLSYTNVDVIFATFFTAAAALCVLGAQRRSLPLTAAAGAVLGLTTFMTYATVFLALAMAIAIAVETRSLRQIVRLGLATIAGAGAVLAILWVTLGFDVISTYQQLPRSPGKYYQYFIAGHPASVLVSAGLPLAALGLAGLVIKVPGARRPILPLALVAIMFVWGILPPTVTALRQGEVERTWAFLYPLLAAAAAPVIDRWIGSARMRAAWAGAIVGLLILITVAQAGVIQALWDNIL
jgi:hypothetical protein